MGFILTNLCEALKSKFKKDKQFKHITLIEEAHRLLSKYSPGDSLNKKNSVETFADMLAEVRKYGESLIIADQIPNKMTPEVLKNTNTKIVHKIFAEDDKEAIGNTISLSKEQKDFLSSLTTGRAIVFSQGWTKALQVKIKEKTNTTSNENIDEDKLKNRVKDFYIENYKKAIFIGTKYKKISKEDFELCREFSTNKEFVKVFKEIFEDKIDTFEDFEFIAKKFLKYKSITKLIKNIYVDKINSMKDFKLIESQLETLLDNESFLENIKYILLKEENKIKNFETFKEEFRKYYKDSFSKDLYKIIYSLYYNNLSKEELKDVYLGISDVFNEGNILETKGKELTEEYRKNLKNRIIKN